MLYTALTRTITESIVTLTPADAGKMAQFFGEDGTSFWGTIAFVPSSSTVILAEGESLPGIDMEIIDLTVTGEEFGGARLAYIEEIRSMIKDDSAKLTKTVGGDLDKILTKALTDYAIAKPFTVRKRAQGNGTDLYPLTGETGILGDYWKHGFSAIRGIEYPVGRKPKEVMEPSDYELYDDGTEQDGSNIALRFNDTIISQNESFIVEFSIEREIPSSGAQNFPETKEQFSNITTLASAYACQRLAAAYAQSADATIGADSVNYHDKSAKYQSLAKQYLRQYNLKVYGSEDPVVAVSAAIESRSIQRKDSKGDRFLFHDRRR